jgi:hypothetical protein
MLRLGIRGGGLSLSPYECANSPPSIRISRPAVAAGVERAPIDWIGDEKRQQLCLPWFAGRQQRLARPSREALCNVKDRNLTCCGSNEERIQASTPWYEKIVSWDKSIQ